MSKSRGARKLPGAYLEPDSSDDDFGLMSSILNIFASHRARRTKRKTPNKQIPVGNNVQPAKKRTKASAQSKAKPRKEKHPKNHSTALSSVSQIELDSDTETPNSSLTQNLEAGIQHKLNSFFKALESDEEESDEGLRAKTAAASNPLEAKPKDFYTILSDSDGQDEHNTLDGSNFKVSTVPCESDNDRLLPSTSTSHNRGNTSNTNDNTSSKKKSADLFSYVDDILNECDVIDLDSRNQSSSALSLDDLKKKANAILNDVTSYAEELQPKEPEKKKPESPVKEVPTCPVCLEILGGARQAMATLCGHIFCRQCLNGVMTTTKKCPSCRVRLTKAKYHPIYI